MTKRKANYEVKGIVQFYPEHCKHFGRANKLRKELLVALSKAQFKLLELESLVKESEPKIKEKVTVASRIASDHLDKASSTVWAQIDRALARTRTERGETLAERSQIQKKRKISLNQYRDSKKKEIIKVDDDTAIVPSPKSKFLFKKLYKEL